MFFAEGVCVIFPSSHNEWEDRDNAFEDAFWLKFGRKEEAENKMLIKFKMWIMWEFLYTIYNNRE